MSAHPKTMEELHFGYVGRNPNDAKCKLRQNFRKNSNSKEKEVIQSKRFQKSFFTPGGSPLPSRVPVEPGIR